MHLMEIDIHDNNNANNCNDDTDGDEVVIIIIKTILRGNFRPKQCPPFGCSPEWFIFFKTVFYQKQYKYATSIGVAQIRGALL